MADGETFLACPALCTWPFGHTWQVGISSMERNLSSQVWVVIAAYNEASVIHRVISDVACRGYSVIVVDDGSSDHTAAAAFAADRVICHPINLGQGAALQTGMDYALEQGAKVIVTFDADGQHRAADIARLVRALEKAQADFALGSRFLGGPIDLPRSRLWLLKAATLFTQLSTGLRLSDTHNGLRAMTCRGAGAIRLRQNRMAHASEILSQIATSGLKYVEVPVNIEYNIYSLAKGQRLGDALMILLDLFARRLYR
ncbi:MAG TPA: glycosyltransferase family 2 protein [Xanthobacteraceae bacterium]|nr:glycosyltransferase family 2 protein [Xanthobacteraceae bacterium]